MALPSLVFVLELTPSTCAAAGDPKQFADALLDAASLWLFRSATHRVAVVAATPDDAQYLWPVQPEHSMRPAVQSGISSMWSTKSGERVPRLARALAMALCFINKNRNPKRTDDQSADDEDADCNRGGHVVLISGGGARVGEGGDRMSLMNAVHTARTIGVPLSTVWSGSGDCFDFYKHAGAATGGIVVPLRPDQGPPLPLCSVLVSGFVTADLQPRKPLELSDAAPCVVDGRPLRLALVCPVCLAAQPPTPFAGAFEHCPSCESPLRPLPPTALIGCA
eukprot:TRINITY_DN33341_c0_g1_i1.p1 TRINITY_DN33341_c0_g1~~TRINITY_DN33341_c0_g1_i1.p1  ORF type:complete len:300 (+),score=36.70 TRINITY_DN33341_c0_g1_i1:64-900(+)